MINKKGVTYYKLESDYPGDVTKYCGLSGVEIDANFHFLRGQDVRDVSFDSEKGELTITRVDGSQIIVEGVKSEIETKIETIVEKHFEEITLRGTYFDEDKMELHLVINDDEVVIGGFRAEKTVFSDDTLFGIGSDTDPLGVLRTIMTGFHLPAKGYVDMIAGEQLPSVVEKHDVYLSRENISSYGLLYNYEGVERIKSILSGNLAGWRVPTSKEWGEMLNYLEDCDDRNHNSEITGDVLGARAGLYIKSKNGEWDIDPSEYEGCVDSYLFNALPTGYARRDGTHHCFGEMTTFWTADKYEGINNVYCRRIDDHEDGVYKIAEGLYYYYSLRLVRDYEGSFSEIETISGVPYHTVLMPYIDESGNTGTKVWTRDNVSFTGLLGGTNDSEIHQKGLENPLALPVIDQRTGEVVSGATKYFVNAWAGTYWEKRELLENEVIPLAVGPDGSRNEQWVLINGELLKVTDITNEHAYNSLIGPISGMIYDEQVAREQEDANIREELASEVSARTESDNQIMNALDTEVSARTEADNEIMDALNAEVSARTEADNNIMDALNAETSARTEADYQLSDALNVEISERIDADGRMAEDLDAEAFTRSEADNQITDALNTEISARTEADNTFDERLNDEIQTREANDIKVQEYLIKASNPDCGTTLLTNGGEEIKIAFDGNFGEFVGEEV